MSDSVDLIHGVFFTSQSYHERSCCCNKIAIIRITALIYSALSVIRMRGTENSHNRQPTDFTMFRVVTVSRCMSRRSFNE